MKYYLVLLSLVFTHSFSQATDAQYKEIPVLDTVQVTDSFEKVSRNVKDSPSAIVILGEDDIIEAQADNIRDLFDGVPGVEFTGGPRGTIQKPQIRGIGDDRVLILIDGARQNFSTQHNGNTFVDTDLFKSVEVLKGSASALYGNNALGGALIFKRKYADDFLKDSSKNVGAQISQYYYSNNNGLKTRASVYGMHKNTGLAINYGVSETGDVVTGNGDKINNTGAEHYDISANLHHNFSKGHRIEFTSEKFRNNGLWVLNLDATENPFSNPPTQTNNERTTHQVNYQYNPQNNKYINFSVSAYNNTVEVGKETTTGNSILSDVETLGIDLKNTSDIVIGDFLLQSTVGVEYFTDEQDGTRNGVEQPAYADAKIKTLGVFWQPSFEIPDKLRISPSVRYDSYEIEPLNSVLPNNEEDQISSKIATVYFVNDFKFTASYGEAFNAPRALKLFASGLHFDGNGPAPGENVFIPNPNLLPETSRSYEVGMNYSKKYGQNSVNADLNFFQSDIKNFIYQAINGAPPSFVGTTQYLNLDNVRNYGFEAAINYNIPKLIDINLNYTQVKIFDRDSRSAIALSPADKWNLGLKSDYFESVNFGTSLTLRERQTDLSTTSPTGGFETETPSQFVQDIFINYTEKLSKNNFMGESVSIGLRVNNLHNKFYKPHNTILPSAGRDIRLNFTVKL